MPLLARKEELFPSGDRAGMVITLDPMHNEQFTKMSTEGQLRKLDLRFGGREG